MPKRQSIRTLPSIEVQGEDSWVTVKYPDVKFMRKSMSAREGELADKFEAGLDVIKTHVLDWNWVDDDGNSLPSPKDDPTVVDQLTSMEIQWLAGHLNPDKTPGEKNSNES